MDSIRNPQNNNTSNSKNVIIAVSALALLVVGIGTAAFLNNSKENVTVNNNSTSTTATPTITTTTTAVITTSSAYKNGSYSATGNYFTPGGEESIDLTVKIENNVITDASIVKNALDSDSKNYQSIFANNFKQFVVGKNVDSVQLSRVSGSSLTSSGFNTALAKIKINAKA